MAQHRHGFAVRDAPPEIEHGDMLRGFRHQRHVVVEPDRIIICGGFAQGLSLLARYLHIQGETAFGDESPGDSKDCAVFQPAGGAWLYARQVESEMTETKSARVSASSKSAL